MSSHDWHMLLHWRITAEAASAALFRNVKTSQIFFLVTTPASTKKKFCRHTDSNTRRFHFYKIA